MFGIAGDLAAEFTDRRFRKFGPSSTIVPGVFREGIFPDLQVEADDADTCSTVTFVPATFCDVGNSVPSVHQSRRELLTAHFDSHSEPPESHLPTGPLAD